MKLKGKHLCFYRVKLRNSEVVEATQAFVHWYIR